jgi:hypothetical protein
MLKLSIEQMHKAVRLAGQIAHLESAKDHCNEPLETCVGFAVIPVPKAFALAGIAAELDKKHAALAAMGIELAPSDANNR